MKNFVYLLLLPVWMLFAGCEKKDGNCGPSHESNLASPTNIFQDKADIYWGLSGNVRSFTYNWEIDNICTESNPKVRVLMGLMHSNTTVSNPFSVSGGIYTCLGVQAQHVILTPNDAQDYYTSPMAEIGMQQCYGGQPSGKIYPYVTVSFTTLGSGQADSLYFIDNVLLLGTDAEYYLPK